MSLRRRMTMQKSSLKYKYGLYKAGKIASKFDFGIAWSEVDKIVLVADSMQSTVGIKDRGNMLFCAYKGAYIYIGFQDGNLSTPGLENVTFNLTPKEYNDEANKLHEYVFTFNCSFSGIITNYWDIAWSEPVRYFKIEFWKGDKLLRQFVPVPLESNKLYDTVNGTTIIPSNGGYVIQEVK